MSEIKKVAQVAWGSWPRMLARSESALVSDPELSRALHSAIDALARAIKDSQAEAGE